MTQANKAFTPIHSSEHSQVNPLESAAHEQTLNTPVNVLITRPKDKSLELANLLNQQSIRNTSYPLFSYEPLASSNEVKNSLKHADIVIFVSIAAVNFAHNSNALTDKLPQTVFAVGQATKKALNDIGVKRVISPELGQEHSEGLLKLPLLTNIKGKNILIVRGNGGREYLADNLSKRGAKVSYLESYQREWRTITNNCVEQWFTLQINCIVVTSNDILLTLYKNLKQATTSTNPVDNYWLTQCLWVVVSERLESNAKNLGLVNVLNAHGASSKILCDTIKAIATA